MDPAEDPVLIPIENLMEWLLDSLEDIIPCFERKNNEKNGTIVRAKSSIVLEDTRSLSKCIKTLINNLLDSVEKSILVVADSEPQVPKIINNEETDTKENFTTNISVDDRNGMIPVPIFEQTETKLKSCKMDNNNLENDISIYVFVRQILENIVDQCMQMQSEVKSNNFENTDNTTEPTPSETEHQICENNLSSCAVYFSNRVMIADKINQKEISPTCQIEKVEGKEDQFSQEFDSMLSLEELEFDKLPNIQIEKTKNEKCNNRETESKLIVYSKKKPTSDIKFPQKENAVDIDTLNEKIDFLENKIEEQKSTLRKLKHVKIHSQQVNLNEMDVLVSKWKRSCQAALIELQRVATMPDGSNPSINLLLGHFNIEPSLLGL